MADERPRADRAALSEQQEELEPRWDADRDPRPATEEPGPQYSPPGGGGDLLDDESDAIADQAGPSYLRGPEDGAMHLEDEDGHHIDDTTR